MNLDELQKQAKQQKEDLMKNIRIKPSIWQRLKRLPIYLHKSGGEKTKLHISDEELAQKMPKEREKFLSMVKEYPEVIDEIEKHPRLEQIIFTERTIPSEKQRDIPFSKRKSFIRGQTEYDIDTSRGNIGESIKKQIQKDEANIVISLRPFPYEPKSRLNPDLSESIFHELRHVGQFETYHKQPSRFNKLFKGKYVEQKGEIQARTYAKKKTEYEPLREWQKQYEQGKTAIQGSLQNQEVRDAIRRANLALKGTI